MIPLTTDPPAHRGYRNLLNASLSPKAVKKLELNIRRMAVDLTENVRLAGKCNFNSEFAEIFPVHLFLAMVDLPVSDAPHITHLQENLTRPDGSMTFQEAMQGFYDYIGPLVEARRGSGRDDLLSTLINATVDGRPVTHEEAMELGINVLMGGIDTVANFLGFMMVSLARDSGLRRSLARDRGLIPAAVDEYLRRFPIVVTSRVVVADMIFEGAEMKAGDMMVVPTTLHGLDPLENAHPLSVDLDRSTREHSTFGGGVHRCAGAQLARTELRIVLEEWLARIPEFGVDPAATLEYRAGTVGCVTAVPLVWDVAATHDIAMDHAVLT